LGFLVADSSDLQFVVRLVRADHLGQIAIGADHLVAGRRDEVARLEPGLDGGAVLADGLQLSAADAVLALNAQVGAGLDRPTADLLRLDDGEDEARVLAIVVDADAAKLT